MRDFPRRPPVLPWVFLGISLALVAFVVLWATGVWNTIFGLPALRPYPGVFGSFLLVFLVLWVAFFAVRILWWTRWARAPGQGPHRPHRDLAVAIARQRYARGEISREEFERIMTDLGRRVPPVPGDAYLR